MTRNTARNFLALFAFYLFSPIGAHAAAFQFGGLRLDALKITSSGSATPLTKGDKQNIILTGSATGVMKLPDATTLQSGYFYEFSNESSGSLVISNSSSTALVTLTAGQSAKLMVTSTSTSGGPWSIFKGAGSGGGSGLTLLGHVDLSCSNDNTIGVTTIWTTVPACTGTYTCTAYGSVACPSTNRYGVRLTSPAAGTYKFSWNSMAMFQGGGARSYVGMTDGTNIFAKVTHYSGGSFGFPYAGGEVYYASSQSTADYVLSAGSSVNVGPDNASSPGAPVDPVQVFVYYTP